MLSNPIYSFGELYMLIVLREATKLIHFDHLNLKIVKFPKDIISQISKSLSKLYRIK